MQWYEIRARYPDQWLIIEAIKACSEGGKRVLEKLSVVNTFADSAAAMSEYLELHHEQPQRELYVVHTTRETLEVTERRWLGIRGGQ